MICLIMLRHSSTLGANRLCELAKNLEYAELLIQLCKRACSQKHIRREFLVLLNEKSSGKTPFYYAAESGNEKFVRYILGSRFGIEINDSGPASQPCALLAATNNGEYTTLKTMLQSMCDNPGLGQVSQRTKDFMTGQQAEDHMQDLTQLLALTDSSIIFSEIREQRSESAEELGVVKIMEIKPT
jgi:hypothetical protein